MSPIRNLVNLESVAALRISMDAGEETVAYYFRPIMANNRAVIVHQGHACVLDDGPGSGNRDLGIQRTIRALLSAGYSVVAMNMPRMRPANGEMNDPGDCRFDHASVMSVQTTSGHPMKLFVEPVAVVVNYIAAEGYSDLNMIGLSGGGWTTTLYAAIDPRVRVSIPVAGSLPLYLRVEPYSHDAEQTLPELFGSYENGVPGIATYLDLYLLGARGDGRSQFQILNRQDDSVFGERQHNSSALGASFDEAVRDYESRLKAALDVAGPGSFRLIVDESAPNHMISNSAIETYILPALAGDTLPTTVRNVWGPRCLDIPYWGRAPEAGDPVLIHVCHGNRNQRFTFRDDGTVRSESGGLCWSAGDPGCTPGLGDQLVLDECRGGPSQEFEAQPDGTIKSRASGLCVELEFFDRAPQDGDRLRLFECHGKVNQRFSVNL